MSTPEDDRREHPRVKTKVSVELREEGSKFPMGGGTADLSVTGCYIENIFPFAVGTTLELKLRIFDGTLPVLAKVVTCDPQVGNGMVFINMPPEDIQRLHAFLDAQLAPTGDEARAIYLKALAQKASSQL